MFLEAQNPRKIAYVMSLCGQAFYCEHFKRPVASKSQVDLKGNGALLHLELTFSYHFGK